MNTELIELVAEEIRSWIEKHPDRAEQACDGLDFITTDKGVAENFSREQMAGLIDLANMIGKALGRN